MQAALAVGHEVTFFTADLAHYQRNGSLEAYLSRARAVIEIQPFSYAAFEKSAAAIHGETPFDGILCLIDIRIIEAAALAERLGLRFLNPQTATLLRDKYRVRCALAERGIAQPDFALATHNGELRNAVSDLGLPVIVKPCDGYGSQNITMLLTDDDINPLIDPLDHYLPCRTDYGLGVTANDRLLVERYIEGTLIGCDTLTLDGKHVMLGINEKSMFPPPFGAIQGSCFPSDRFDVAPVREYVFAVLDAVGFNDGASHTEIILSAEGPLLVEVNPRLVGAKIPRLLNLAFGRSVHRDLIDLHLGIPPSAAAYRKPDGYAVSRWIVAERAGTLADIRLPQTPDRRIKQVEILKTPGDAVTPPYQNSDRIGCVMALAETRAQAEQCANAYVSQVELAVI
ncbi:ATP-grasp domain-containing protein [Methylogaea oryzae]|uniref:ATP-grasp domain-containing protein n=1 Tax=Methylogaea oryzae TaxID=1295382 RepID=UPI001C7F0DEC|nr:ATP-grasp domain-containing protein [Methylogaea oryzae]